MSLEEVAAGCRAQLRDGLQIADKLLSPPRSPSEFLLQRANTLLGTIVASDFDSVALAPLADLYGAIERCTREMQGQCGDLALLHFSRSLAVVLEEALKRAAEARSSSQRECCSRCSSYSNGAESATAVSPPPMERARHVSRHWSEAQEVKPLPLGRGEGGQREAGMAKMGDYDEEEEPLMPPKPRPASSRRQDVPIGTLVGQKAAPAAVTRPERRPDADFDYSPEARKGRIHMQRIPVSVKKEEVEAFLRPIGAVLSLSYPSAAKGVARGFAYAKFESDEQAEEAVSKLDGKELGGQSIRVALMTHWYRNRPPGGFLKAHELAVMPPPRFGCYVAPEMGEARKEKENKPAERDSDDESESGRVD